jgi:hypothetical protein
MGWAEGLYATWTAWSDYMACRRMLLTHRSRDALQNAPSPTPHLPNAVHPVAEVRGRTLQSLDFKWKYGLVGADELAAEPRVLAALLRESTGVVATSCSSACIGMLGVGPVSTQPPEALTPLPPKNRRPDLPGRGPPDNRRRAAAAAQALGAPAPLPRAAAAGRGAAAAGAAGQLPAGARQGGGGAAEPADGRRQ